MSVLSSALTRRFVASVAVGALLAVAAAVPATAEPGHHGDDHGSYLALGDSVAFGYVPPLAVPPPNYSNARSFRGYPEVLGRILETGVVNASCPGETTASMISVTAKSNGCENSPVSPFGYRSIYPLHVSYSGPQLAYAVSYLRTHRQTDLVTIDIGANDAFVCQETTTDQCASQTELSAVLGSIATNLSTIYRALRVQGGYSGRLVALSYYSISYADRTQVAQAAALNQVISRVTKAYGGRVADGFGAFGLAAAFHGGDSCAAGLLIKLPDGTCNIHPSPFGHLVLAGAIAAALRR